MIHVAIALGSNLEPRLQHLRAMVEAIADFGSIQARSRIYETSPVGPEGQGPYLNAVVALATEMMPRELLGKLKSAEQELGRQARGRWAEREIDADIVLVNHLQMHHPELQIPHPELTRRDFVLKPLSDVWNDCVIPGTSKRISEHLASITQTTIQRTLDDTL